MGRLAMLAASAALALTAVVGCASAPPPPPTPSSTTAAPVFASEEEALAAATEAYAAYIRVVDEVLATGGGNALPLSEVSSGEALAAETETAAMFASRGYRSVGSSTFDSLEIQAVHRDEDGRVSIGVYVCSDVTAVDVVDGSGNSVVTAERSDRYPLEIHLENHPTEQQRLLIASSEAWTGRNFC
jgi:hypothetical protein